MTISEFLSHLHELDIKIWADNGRLRLDAPKDVLTPELRAELAERKAEILVFLHGAAAMAHSSTTPIEPVARDEELPLSFAQQRLWFLDRLEPGGASYNVHQAIRLSGTLDVKALQRALEAIVERHEALRTTFSVADGSPVQVIAPTLSVSLPTEDLSGLAEGEREAQAEQRAREEARRPFDLERGPLLRAKLLRLDDEEHVLLLAVHHIVSDAWSIGVLFREVATLYEAFSQGKPSPLAELPIQYADFAVWQREWLQGEVLDKQLSYWKERLANVPALELPTDRPRPAVQTHRGTQQELVLPQALSEALKELSQREGATLFMVLLATFQALLSRYSGQEDVAVGTPIAGRNRAETEGLVGFFVNTLVMRADLSGDPTFKELLGRVREAAVGAYDHQDLPFERLVEELKPERDRSRSPLFQVMFALQNAPLQALELAELTLNTFPADRGTTKFDLTLTMVEESEGLKGSFGYNTDLFDAGTITRMAGHFQTLLEGIVRDPEQRLGELPLLTPSERRQLLVEWNDTRANYPGDDSCIHEVFEAQAARTPDAVALTFEGQLLTYAELNAQANQLARYLRKLEVGPEALVGICVERSVEMVVGVLGVLKAGGAYVPLDPSYPQERLSLMIEDARTPVVLTQERLAEGLPEHGARVVRMDSDRKKIAEESAEDLAGEARVDDLAYVIYTSGSTGRPKGVMIEHRALNTYVAAAAAAYEIGASDRVLQLASLSFDASVEEIFPCLTRGGTLVLRSDQMVASMQRFVRECQERAISVLSLPTAFWHELVPELEGERLALPPSVRLVIIGGEEALAQRAAQWHAYTARSAHSARLINTYGPTEATVVATLCELRAEGSHDSSTRSGVPIGRPLGNAQSYILDGYSNPVPIGVPGELHIGGVGLARGYLHRPELTAEKFVPHPFSNEPGARLYKTGDLACYRPDGNIEFLGRRDQQVKVRGYRIEVGEIEAVLSRHPGVRESAVLAREDEAGGKRLVAYMVSHRAQEAPSISELRGFLKEKLPEYMVPSAFVELEALPLTPSGKVDRQGLPAPGGGRPELERAYIAPRTALEQFLAHLWQDMLGIERIGVHDDFFELGGDSIRGAVLLNRLQQALGEVVHVVALFDAPTVADLAVYLNQHYPDAVARLYSTKPSSGEFDIDDSASIRKAMTPMQPVAPQEPNADLNRLPADIDQLTDEEVDSLLSEAIDAGEIDL